MTDLNLKQKREERKFHFKHLHDVEGLSCRKIGEMKGISGERVRQIIGGGQRPKENRLLNIYRYIEGYQATYFRSPTMREIGERFPSSVGNPSSTRVVSEWLNRMAEAGMMKPRERNIARSIVLLKLNRKDPQIHAMLEQEKENQNGN